MEEEIMTRSKEEDKDMCTGGRPIILGGSTGGVVFPLLGDWEADWPDGVKVVLYITGLLWCFMGVSIIADVFMSAIEKVTSRKRTIKRKDGKNVTIVVWNATVANLTLMALGSSAPEILLSVIELLLTNEMHAGDLGPSTIVGSAAFNLMVIIAVCVSALPTGETRRIDELGVFIVTASFSIFAYIWLLVILLWISPDVVEIWEGLVTFAFFPVLVFVAYLFDVKILDFNLSTPRDPHKLVLSPHTSKEEFEEMCRLVHEKYGCDHTDEERLQVLVHYEFAPGMSRAAHRVKSGRRIFGKKRIKMIDRRRISKQFRTVKKQASHITRRSSGAETPKTHTSVPKVQFERISCAVLEGEKARIHIRKSGGGACTVRCRTVDNTATVKDQDYVAVDEELVFAEGEDVKEIAIDIIPDGVSEQTEDFFVELYQPQNCLLGKQEKTTVVIIDADYTGRLQFEKDSIDVLQSSADQTLNVKVLRTGGAKGTVSCSYKLDSDSAKAGKDFEEASGKIEFKDGELSKQIDVKVLAKTTKWDGVEVFRIVLSDPENTEFPANTDGGKDTNICTVTIRPDDKHRTFVDNAMQKINWHELELGSSNWKEQFMEAILCGGSWEAQHSVSWLDIFIHWIVMPWKLIFAFVPPVDFAGGWLCFFLSLVMIGCVTAVIGDLAMLVGCSIGICDQITAITFVALGTSLPDTFASKSAAVGDPNADNSIGNVTGSNSVNVFLGLGLPWSIGAIYWHITGQNEKWRERAVEKSWPKHVLEDYSEGVFVVPSEGLGDSVATFAACAVVVLATLGLRRARFGAELGGDRIWCLVTSVFFVALWGVYLTMSIILLDC